MLAPQHAVSLCKSVGSPARWAANEKVLPSLHAGPTVSFYYWDLIFCVRYSVAPGAGLVEVEVGRNVAADVTMVLMRENPRNCSYHCTDWPWRHGGRGGGRDIN